MDFDDELFDIFELVEQARGRPSPTRRSPLEYLAVLALALGAIAAGLWVGQAATAALAQVATALGN